MPQRIQRFPNGYLGLIGNTSGGETPNLVADQVVGTIDLHPYYYNNSQVRQFYVSGASALGLGARVFWPVAGSIPQGKTMWLHGASIVCTAVAAAEAIKATFTLFQQGSGGMPLSANLSFAATELPFLGWTGFSDPLPLQEGDQIGMYVTARTGATVMTVSITGWYSIL